MRETIHRMKFIRVTENPYKNILSTLAIFFFSLPSIHEFSDFIGLFIKFP